jgi:hypothetical protein
MRVAISASMYDRSRDQPIPRLCSRYTENFDPPFLGPLREVTEILQPSPSEGLAVVEIAARGFLAEAGRTARTARR